MSITMAIKRANPHAARASETPKRHRGVHGQRRRGRSRSRARCSRCSLSAGCTPRQGTRLTGSTCTLAVDILTGNMPTPVPLALDCANPLAARASEPELPRGFHGLRRRSRSRRSLSAAHCTGCAGCAARAMAGSGAIGAIRTAHPAHTHTNTRTRSTLGRRTPTGCRLYVPNELT